MLDVINIEVHFFQAPLKEQAPPYTSSPPRVLAINQSSATTRSIFQKKNRSHLPPFLPFPHLKAERAEIIRFQEISCL